MIIECPVCPKPAPRYKIDASLIGAEGREVRCPRCGHEWFVTPDEVAMQTGAPLQSPQHPDPASIGGRYPTSQQIVGVTFDAAPPYDAPNPYDEPDEGMGTGGCAVHSSASFPPEPVSAGAALAGAAAGSEGRSAGTEASDDAVGASDVPTTAAEIASAFFSSSFEGENLPPPPERHEEPKASFSLWAALDSVRPLEDEVSPRRGGMSPASEAPLSSEPKTAFHGRSSQLHETTSFDDPPAFDEAAEFAHLPDAEDEELSHARADTYWSRSFQASAGEGESAYATPDSPSNSGEPLAGAASRDEELRAALASGAGWSDDEPSTASPPPRQAHNAPEDWAPANETKEIARLVEALNGRESSRPSGDGYGDSAASDRRASYWPSERQDHNDGFDASEGWRSTAPAADSSPTDLENFSRHFSEPDEEPSPRSSPSFLGSRQNYPETNYSNQDYPPDPFTGDDFPTHEEESFEPIPARTALVRRPSSDFHPDDDFPGDFDEALASAERRKMGGLAVAAAWGVFITIAAGLGGVALHFRENIAARLPGTARLYQALNVPVAAHGGKLELANVKYRWALRDEQPLIALEGDIVSRSNSTERVPALVVAIRDADRTFPQKRIETLSTEQIEANATTHFTIDVTHPPKGVNEIAIEFVK